MYTFQEAFETGVRFTRLDWWFQNVNYNEYPWWIKIDDNRGIVITSQSKFTPTRLDRFEYRMNEKSWILHPHDDIFRN